MNQHTEAPNTLAERLLCAAAMAGALATAAWLVPPLLTDLDGNHTVRFVALAMLLGLSLYLLWLLLALSTVRYTLTPDRLLLRQGLLGRAEIPLGPETHIHRWRRRWGWSGNAERDLGVEEIALFPAGPVLRGQSTWVALYRRPDGQLRAAAFRPSATLLEGVRARVKESESAAG